MDTPDIVIWIGLKNMRKLQRTEQKLDHLDLLLPQRITNTRVSIWKLGKKLSSPDV